MGSFYQQANQISQLEEGLRKRYPSKHLGVGGKCSPQKTKPFSRTFGRENSASDLNPRHDNSVDGRNPANQLIWRISHYLHGSIHPKWLVRFPSTVSIRFEPSLIFKSHAAESTAIVILNGDLVGTA